MFQRWSKCRNLLSLQTFNNYNIVQNTCVSYFSTFDGIPNNQDVETENKPALRKMDFRYLVEGLRIFRQEYGHVCVPTAFRVPENNTTWPQYMAKYPLGYRLCAMMTKHIYQQRNPGIMTALNVLGIPLNRNCRDFQWDNTMVALEAYKAIHGHVIVPIAFRVPTGEDTWPRSTWGMKLGCRVHTLRRSQTRLPPNQVRDLERIGFEWDSRIARRKLCMSNAASQPSKEKKKSRFAGDFSHLVPGLKLFQQAYGHVVVPSKFVVPHTEPWPFDMQGYPLGRKLRSMMDICRHQNQYPEVVLSLAELGIPFEMSHRGFLWEEQVLPALQTFKAVHGHVIVPKTFIIPNADDKWPRSTWGMRLGVYVNKLRMGKGQLMPEELQSLEEIGFIWNVDEHRWTEIILPSLRIYKQLYGHCCVSSNFIIPAQAPWPKIAWGFHLGSVVATMRLIGTYAHRDVETLESLGFVWDYRLYRWKSQILPALCVYQKVYGKKRVPNSFIVPSQLPWPKATWNLKLGYAVKSIQHDGAYQQQIKQDHELLEESDLYQYLVRHKV